MDGRARVHLVLLKTMSGLRTALTTTDTIRIGVTRTTSSNLKTIQTLGMFFRYYT